MKLAVFWDSVYVCLLKEHQLIGFN
jgi:hypothetical protein